MFWQLATNEERGSTALVHRYRVMCQPVLFHVYITHVWYCNTDEVV